MDKYLKIEFSGVFLLDEEKFFKNFKNSLINLICLIYEDKNKKNEITNISCTINNNIDSSLKFGFSTFNNSPSDISDIFINHFYYEWLDRDFEDYDIYINDIFTIEVK